MFSAVSHLLRGKGKSNIPLSRLNSIKSHLQDTATSRTMATATQISITPEYDAHFHAVKPSDGAPKRISELLQENHNRYHIYFNDEGFHNHIVHHLLALYALGASTKDIEFGYSSNDHYQRPLVAPSSKLSAEKITESSFDRYLGNEAVYSDYLSFFTSEISSKGYQSVINTYLLSGSARANDMLVRLYSGFLHPLIHLGYGVEYAQPAIVAEALAQAATHNNWIGTLFYQAEAQAQQTRPSGSATLADLAQQARTNDKLYSSVHREDTNKIRDGVLKRAPDELVSLAAQWTVSPAQIEAKKAEIVTFAAFSTLGAQRPPKAVKMDFFLMHSINTCPVAFALVDQDWVRPEHKARLLEWFGRTVLALYVSRGSPELLYEEIQGYTPLKQGETSWEKLYDRVNGFKDDGHAVKFIRALKFGEQLTKEFEGEKWCTLKGGDWLQGANMVLDSVQGTSVDSARFVGTDEEIPKEPGKWVRNAGTDEAWEDVPERERWGF